MSYSIITGDCRTTMAAMEPDSVDAIVTDPPYGLSSESANGYADRVLNALSKISLPDLDKLEPGLSEQVDLRGVPLDGSDLSRRKARALGVGARIGVPERPVDLDHGSGVGDVEVDAGRIATGDGVADAALPLEPDAAPGEFLGDYVLDLRDACNSSAGDVLSRCLSEPAPGRVGVSVVVACLPGRDCPLARLLSRRATGGGHDVSALDDSGRDAGTSPGVMALTGAVVRAVLAFGIADGSLQLEVARSTADLDSASTLHRGPQLIRALPRASGLAAVAESHGVRVVLDGADGAGYWLRLWLRRGGLRHFESMKPRGGFMGKDWDSNVPGPAYWREALRVAKPGAHLLAFGGTRLWHRLAVAIEEAGWEIRDTVMWLHGQGFPKAKSCLKPAWEPIVLARKPGAVRKLEVDACRIGTTVETWPASRSFAPGISPGYTDGIDRGRTQATGSPAAGRWPANLILDESAAAALDEQSGVLKARGNVNQSVSGGGTGNSVTPGAPFPSGHHGRADLKSDGGASRFFYVAKPSRAERNNGGPNRHPTVKPIALMRHLVRLVTPPGGLVLDPFAGSGTTGCAARLEGFRFVGCEMDPGHADLARSRIAAVESEPVAAEPEQADLFEGVA